MSEIALYNLLKKIPDATDDEIERAVADVANAKDVATKADIVKLEKFIAERETQLTWQLVIAISIAVGIIKYL